MFRSELRSLYLTNFGALADPRITMEDLKTANPKELAVWLQQVKDAKYRSPEAMESVITEYVNAYHVFDRFLQWAIVNDCERIFHDMILLMHFIHDAKLFKRSHPEKMFITQALENPELMEKVRTVLTAGLTSFLSFCIDLKVAEPSVFLTLIEDYRFSAGMMPAIPETNATA